MNTYRSGLAFAFIVVVALATQPLAARDWNKEQLFNTFYLETPTGTYELTITKSNTYSLKAPRSRPESGTIWASDDEIGFFAGTTNRHFEYRFANGDLVLTPTKKDGPDATTNLGRMPPQGRGNPAVFVSFQNRRVVVQPPPVIVQPPPRPINDQPVWVQQPQVVQPQPEQVAPPANWDGDKKSLYNTFFMETPTGLYELTISRDRNFRLKGPGRRNVATGQIWASDEEVGFFAGDVNRHFAYSFDGAGNLVLRPTKKDTPDTENVLGTLPPIGRGTAATLVAFQNRQQIAPPVVIAPPPVIVQPPPRRRGHYEQRSEYVIVTPARIEQRYVPATTETRLDAFRRPYTIETSPAHFENVEVPAQYEQRKRDVWVDD